MWRRQMTCFSVSCLPRPKDPQSISTFRGTSSIGHREPRSVRSCATEPCSCWWHSRSSYAAVETLYLPWLVISRIRPRGDADRQSSRRRASTAKFATDRAVEVIDIQADIAGRQVLAEHQRPSWQMGLSVCLSSHRSSTMTARARPAPDLKIGSTKKSDANPARFPVGLRCRLTRNCEKPEVATKASASAQ